MVLAALGVSGLASSLDTPQLPGEQPLAAAVIDLPARDRGGIPRGTLRRQPCHRTMRRALSFSLLRLTCLCTAVMSCRGACLPARASGLKLSPLPAAPGGLFACFCPSEGSTAEQVPSESPAHLARCVAMTRPQQAARDFLCLQQP